METFHGRRTLDLDTLSWRVYTAEQDIVLEDGYVPSHVHSLLITAGKISHPFLGLFESECSWVDERVWVYSTSFFWFAIEGLEHTELQFEGLDTFCDIFLNDEKIASHENMFIPLNVDASKLLNSGKNELKIYFYPPVIEAKKRREAYFKEQSLPADVACFEIRAFARKAQYMYGWDWGPTLPSCGVSGPIRLVDFSNRIDDIWVQQTESEDNFVLSITTKTVAPTELTHRLLDPDGNVVAKRTGDGEFIVPNAKRWSPEHPNLYTLHSSLTNSIGDVIDQKITQLGLRTLRLIQEPQGDGGTSFRFELNDHPIWVRGANWIPDHSFPTTITREQLRNRLFQAKNMGMNMLRVWGGGIYETEDFYDLCDELGILVWQDFPYACSLYPDTGEHAEAARVEAEINVKRLRNRACLAIWCGNNENQQVFEDAWGGIEKRAPRFFGEHLYEKVLPEVCAEHDPSRPYIPGSPHSIDGVKNNDGTTGDQHFWDVWHGRGDWTYYSDSNARFCSEFGFLASPSLDVWRWVLPSLDVQPDNAIVAAHNKSNKPSYLELVELHYPPVKTLEDLVYTTQLNQRDALRFGIEHFRFFPYCAGTLFWQLNDCWPVQSWAVIDSFGREKAAGIEMSRLYNDLLVAVRFEPTPCVKIHSLKRKKVMDECVISWVSMDGKKRHNECLNLTIEPQTITEIELDTPEWEGVPALVYVTFGGCFGWKLTCEPKAVQCNPKPILVQMNGATASISCEDMPVVDLWIYCEERELQVTPNFITLLPGSTKEVRIHGDIESLRARSLFGEHALDFVD